MTRRRSWLGATFALGPVVLGFVPGLLTFALNPTASTDIGLVAMRLPSSVFIAIWSVIFLGMGLAAWQLWRLGLPGGVDKSVPLVVIGAGYLQANTFWLADSLRAIAIADASGLLFAGAAVWAASRKSRRAALWLLPWLVWMPITLTVKVVLLCGTR